MNPVFSVDDLTDSFWPPPAPAPSSGKNGMTRSQSEWAFQRLLEEISVSAGSPISSSSATDNAIGRSPSKLQSEPSVSRPEEAASDIGDVLEIQKPQNDRRPEPSSSAEIDPNHYQEILKTKLDLACAAVALHVATVKPEDSSASSGIQKQPHPLGSQTQTQVVAQMSPDVSSVSILGTQNKPDSQVRQATSGSSRYDSDDEDLDGDTENADPDDVKRAKRMLSNRESARRSRKRKQEQMKELDTQVGQLRAEHSTLLKRLTDMNQKYDAATVDNRILKADIETLRTKVKMAEETVKRVKGINPLLLARSNDIPLDSTPTVSSQRNLKSIFSNITENSKTNVPSVSITGSSSKAGLPQNVALPNHSPKQMNPFPTNETLPHWDLGHRERE